MHRERESHRMFRERWEVLQFVLYQEACATGDKRDDKRQYWEGPSSIAGHLLITNTNLYVTLLNTQ